MGEWASGPSKVKVGRELGIKKTGSSREGVAAEHEIEIEIQPPGVRLHGTEGGWSELPKKGQADRAARQTAGNEQWLNAQWMNWPRDCLPPSSPARGSGLAGFKQPGTWGRGQGTGLRKAISGAGYSPVRCWGNGAWQRKRRMTLALQDKRTLKYRQIPEPASQLWATNLERSRR